MFGRVRAHVSEGAQVIRLYSHEDLVARCQETGVSLLFYDHDQTSLAPRVAQMWRELTALPGLAVVCLTHELTLDLQARAKRSGLMAVLADGEEFGTAVGQICAIRQREIAPKAEDEIAIRTFGETVVTLRGKTVALTRTEYHILRLLIDRKGGFVSTQTLTQSVWGADVTERKEDLYVYIARLREKLEQNPFRPQLIRSSRGFGYAFNGEVWLQHDFA